MTTSDFKTLGSETKYPSNGVKIIIPIEITEEPEGKLHFYTTWRSWAPPDVEFVFDTPDISIPIHANNDDPRSATEELLGHGGQNPPP